jgi:hypothetical protein
MLADDFFIQVRGVFHEIALLQRWIALFRPHMFQSIQELLQRMFSKSALFVSS